MEAEGSIVPYQQGDSIRKMIGKAITAAETTVKRSRRSVKGLIADIKDPNLPWSDLALKAFMNNLPRDPTRWDSAYEKRIKLIQKEGCRVRQEDNDFIVDMLSAWNDMTEKAIADMPK